MKRIIRDSDRASEVILDIRALVKKAPPRQEPVDLNDLISRMLTLANNEMTQNQVEAQTELAADLPSVPGDRVPMRSAACRVGGMMLQPRPMKASGCWGLIAEFRWPVANR